MDDLEQKTLAQTCKEQRGVPNWVEWVKVKGHRGTGMKNHGKRMEKHRKTTIFPSKIHPKSNISN